MLVGLVCSGYNLGLAREVCACCCCDGVVVVGCDGDGCGVAVVIIGKLLNMSHLPDECLCVSVSFSSSFNFCSLTETKL